MFVIDQARISEPHLTARINGVEAPASASPLPWSVFLEAPFTSVPDTAAHHWVAYPLRCLPKRWRDMMFNRIVHRFDSAARINLGQCHPNIPVLILHRYLHFHSTLITRHNYPHILYWLLRSADDRTIPQAHGRRLLAAARDANWTCVDGVFIDGAGHNGVARAAAIASPVAAFLERVRRHEMLMVREKNRLLKP